MKHFVTLVVLLSLGGCAAIPDVQPEDLDRLTHDLEVTHDVVAAIDTSKVPHDVADKIDQARVIMEKAAKVSDLLSRVRRANK